MSNRPSKELHGQPPLCTPTPPKIEWDEEHNHVRYTPKLDLEGGFADLNNPLGAYFKLNGRKALSKLSII